jgi:hypothetical protein
MRKIVLGAVLIYVTIVLAYGQKANSDRSTPKDKEKPCFTAEDRERAERMAHVYRPPDPGYDPVLGYDPATGPRKGAPPVDQNGRALPFTCLATDKPKDITGTLPKFYCTIPNDGGKSIRYKVKPHFKGQSRDKRNGEVQGEFLSSRFSKAMGFFADDEWVADVTCQDCQKSLSKNFQGTPWNAFQPAAGIELSTGQGIDHDCNGEDYAPLAGSLKKLLDNGAPRAQIDAFKLWLAFIDHGDTKNQNQRFACLKTEEDNDLIKSCERGDAIFYVADMGSTFGFSTASEKKARLDLWKGKDPIRVSGGRCSTTAKSIGDTEISEAGRKLLADNLQRLLDAERQNGLITRVFKASRNDERDQPAEAWTAEFIRKARMIIDARCSK